MENIRAQAEKLVGEMTIEEAASQLRYDAPAIDRLGIPAYNWWNEALHGVARAGTATVFPQAIGLAAMFDGDFLEEIAGVIATEARAKYNMQTAKGDRDIYKGLTFWSPNINLFRDPRWGRGHETYGEDPYLTGRLGVRFIQGLQGQGETLKTAACAKHFAVHSGPEAKRHRFNAVASPKDMEESYLPAFEMAVKEGKVEAVMGAYNRTNGEACCGSETLLTKCLRDRWGFQGHVVSDCWAIADFHEEHKITDTAPESAALALKNGCDLNCGVTYLHLLQALAEGLVTQEEIRRSAVRLMVTRIKLGMFAKDGPYDQIPFEENDSPAHRAMCRKAAQKSIVLLKNDGLLPLDPGKLTSVGVIGPTADSQQVLEGNYSGTASEYVTDIEGIREALGEGVRIRYAQGSHLFRDRVENLAAPDDRLAEAVAVAQASDVVIVCVGLDATIEGEAGDTGNSAAGGDKLDLLLPPVQRRLVDAVTAAGKPVVLVLHAGSAMDLSAWEDKTGAMLQCWYSGAQGGRGLADILFGKVSPSGKLPVTFHRDGTLPDFEDYAMKGRTYRYGTAEVFRPFGFGLSYGSVRYDALRVTAQETAKETEKETEKETQGEAKAGRTVSFQLTNQGDWALQEVYQLYIDGQIREKLENGANSAYEDRIDPENQPVYSLVGFGCIPLNRGERKTVTLQLPERAFETVLEDGSRVRLKGRYTLYAGGSQPDEKSRALLGKTVLSTEIQVF